MVRLLSMGIECFSSMIFLVPIIFILQYICFKQRHFCRFVLVLIIAIYFMAVFSITGLPTAYTLRFDFSINPIPFVDIINSPAEYIKNTLLNILLFLPLGFLLPVLWNAYRDAKKTVFAGFAVSVFVELLQIFTFRLTDVDDLITNTLGTALGYGIAKILSFKLPFKIPQNEKTVPVKYEPLILFGTVFLISFFLKPLVSNAMWDAALSSAWWEKIR